MASATRRNHRYAALEHLLLALVLVAHEAFGMNDHIRARARRLAEPGYAVFALEMYRVEGFSLSEAVSRHIELMSAPGLCTFEQVLRSGS